MEKVPQWKQYKYASRATTLLCSRHLEENISRYLTRTDGAVSKINEIFGPTGILHQKDEYEFDKMMIYSLCTWGVLNS